MGAKITVGLIHNGEILKDDFNRLQWKIVLSFWIFQFFRRFSGCLAPPVSRPPPQSPG
jgi:hypothetical protein